MGGGQKSYLTAFYLGSLSSHPDRPADQFIIVFFIIFNILSSWFRIKCKDDIPPEQSVIDIFCFHLTDCIASKVASLSDKCCPVSPGDRATVFSLFIWRTMKQWPGWWLRLALENCVFPNFLTTLSKLNINKNCKIT